MRALPLLLLFPALALAEPPDAGVSPEPERRRRAVEPHGQLAPIPAAELLGERAPTPSRFERVKRPTQVKPGFDVLQGRCDGEDVMRRLRRQLGALKRCYESSLKRNPALSGKLQIEWVIGRGGGVKEARVLEDTLGDPAVARCFVRQFRKMRFAPPPMEADGKITDCVTRTLFHFVPNP